MTVLQLHGRITQEGTLEVKLPVGIEPGEVEVVINRTASPNEIPDHQPLTAEEVAELMKPQTPKTGAEIVAMIESGELDLSGWEHITDPLEWLEDMRQKAWDARWKRDEA